jgi:hypothetical protein
MIIREWMKLPRDKRRAEDQVLSFAHQASERHALKGSGDATARIATWLLPRIAKD